MQQFVVKRGDAIFYFRGLGSSWAIHLTEFLQMRGALRGQRPDLLMIGDDALTIGLLIREAVFPQTMED